jgi:pimeloyl-ACP methyl ester carboxylesterase
VRKAMLKLYRASDSRNFVGWEDELLKLTQRVPALVLWGDADPYAAPATAERFGAQSVEHFAQYGHWLPVEAAGLVANRIDAFA